MADLITMYDDTNVSVEPSGAPAYAGYVDGKFANLTQLRARFPHARILDIAVFPTDDATCLDVEAGDATIADIFGWFKRQQARKVWRPVVYSSVVNMDHIVATMTANGFPRSSYRLWAAHYQAGQHICGPSTCKLTNAQCDGTQFTNTALSRSLDESILLPGFFDPPAPPPQGPFRHVVPAGNTRSLWRVAQDRHVSEDALISLSRSELGENNLAMFNAYVAYEAACVAASVIRPAMGEGLVYWTANE